MAKQQFTKLVIVISFFSFFLLQGLFTEASAAEKWPPDQMEMVMPHNVGSNHDLTTRTLGTIWEKMLGTRFIYNNKGGASGRVGYDYFISQTDENALLSSNLTSASIMYAQQKPKWKWEDSVYPMGLIAIDAGAFFVRSDTPYKTLKDLIEASKKRKITMAISFWASPDNLLVHQVMDQTGAKFEVVPYGSGSDLVTQVLGGNVEAGYSKITGILQGGDKFRILAISLDSNPIPHLTDNVETVDQILGTDTLAVASYRGMLVHNSFVSKFPERYKKLKETFENAKKDPKFIADAKKLGIDDPSLIVAWDHDRLMTILKGYWKAFDQYGHIYKRKK